MCSQGNSTDLRKLIIFSAPSGAGKTTIVQHLLKKFPQLAFSISATTRQPRQGEMDGRDYYFISKEDFLHRVARHEFVERSEEHTSELQSLMRISYAVFCLKKKKNEKQ